MRNPLIILAIHIFPYTLAQPIDRRVTYPVSSARYEPYPNRGPIVPLPGPLPRPVETEYPEDIRQMSNAPTNHEETEEPSYHVDRSPNNSEKVSPLPSGSPTALEDEPKGDTERPSLTQESQHSNKRPSNSEQISLSLPASPNPASPSPFEDSDEDYEAEASRSRTRSKAKRYKKKPSKRTRNPKSPRCAECKNVNTTCARNVSGVKCRRCKNNELPCTIVERPPAYTCNECRDNKPKTLDCDYQKPCNYCKRDPQKECTHTMTEEERLSKIIAKTALKQQRLTELRKRERKKPKGKQVAQGRPADGLVAKDNNM